MGRGNPNRAGQLRSRVLVQKMTPSEDSYGQPIEVFSDYLRLWARIEPLEGAELVDARQITADVTHRMTLRYRDDINHKMRFIMGSRTFHIADAPVADDERNEFLKITVIERQS